MPTIMKERMEVSIRVTPQQAFDFIKHLKQLLES